MRISFSISSHQTFLLSGLLTLVLASAPSGFAQTAQQIMDAACTNDIRQQSSNTLWESTSERRSAGHIFVERTIESVDGDVDQLISVDGHAPGGAEKSKNDKVLQGLLKSAQAREAMHKTMLTENKDATTLMQAPPQDVLARGSRPD